MSRREQTPTRSGGPPDKPNEQRSRIPTVIGSGVALALAALGLTECGWVQQIKLDREVDRLCAIDGGVQIYETVFLPKEDFGPDGEVFPQYRTRLSSEGRYGPDYSYLSAREVLVAGNPSMVRLKGRFVRVSDDKVMGKVVIYVRGGGDLPGPWHPSSHRCPSDPAPDLERQLFKPQEQ